MSAVYEGHDLLWEVKFSDPRVITVSNETLGTSASVSNAKKLVLWIELEKKVIADANTEAKIVETQLLQIGEKADKRVEIGDFVFEPVAFNESYYSYYLKADNQGYRLEMSFGAENPREITLTNKNLDISDVVTIDDVEPWIETQIGILEAQKSGVLAQIKKLGGDDLYATFSIDGIGKESPIKGRRSVEFSAYEASGDLKNYAAWLKDNKFKIADKNGEVIFSIKTRSKHHFYVDNQDYGADMTPALRRAIKKKLGIE